MRVPFRAVLLQSLLVLTPLAYAQTAPVQSLVINWNLVGNNSPASIDPISLFGNLTTPITGISDQINTVWKWNAPGVSWMFYAPSLAPAGLTAYAASKSYGVLSTIPSGDGYWVNAKAPLTLTLPSGTPAATAPVQALVSGWNLAGNNTTAPIDPVTLFGNTTTPLSGITSQIVTVWKWDAVNAGWMFYAPSLTSTALATYAASKSYGVLTTILPGEGFWINSAAALSLALPPVISGVAASGAPIANGNITVTCGDGSTRTTTTDANGVYSIGLANCAAPYVVSVTGNIGDAQELLVSAQATPLAAGSALLTVNVTSLTNAMAASIASSGDPVDLVSNFSAQKANITDAAAKAAKDTLVAAIANALIQAGGDPTTFDLVGTPFSANRTGLDKLLDNLQIQLNGSGISITSPSAVAAVDDMGNNPAGVSADALGSSAFSGATVTIVKSSTAGNVTPLPAGTGGLQDHSIGDLVRDALNACFAQPAATRGSIAANTLSVACQAVPIASDYLNDGNNAAQEFDPFFTNPNNDNAKFNTPEVIRFYSASTTDIRALIKFALTRTDGVVKSYTTVGEKSAATGGAKKLRGNQRLFKVFVNGYVEKRVEIENKNTNNPKSTFYATGINLYMGFVEGGAGGSGSGPAAGPPAITGRKVDYVKVTGPGLPAAGVFLRPTLSGCDSYYAIAASATANPPNCTSLFRMSSRAASATDTDNFASLYGGTRPDFAATKVADTDLVNIQPLSAYKFEIWRTGNATATPDLVYIERLRSRPYTMGTSATAQDGEVDKVRWNTLSADTIAALDPVLGTAFVGGNPSSFIMKWTNQPNAAPTYSVQVQTRAATGTQLYQDQVFVRFSASSAALANANGSAPGWPDMNKTSSTGLNFAQLISRNRFDTQLFADWFY